ncbi:MAG: hypothetical protein K1X85_10655 [Ignavibacteria bacterium]|nr:hypothetical protein [Ignavibacteria bacterium]
MNSNKIKTAALAVLLFPLVLAGCSDYSGPVSSSKTGVSGDLSGVPETAGTLDFKEVTFEFGLDLQPFGETVINAGEIGVSYISSVTLVNASEYEVFESADFCKKISIQTDNQGKSEFTDCSTGNVKAQTVVVKNNSKKRVYAIAVVEAKSLHGISKH